MKPRVKQACAIACIVLASVIGLYFFAAYEPAGQTNLNRGVQNVPRAEAETSTAGDLALLTPETKPRGHQVSKQGGFRTEPNDVFLSLSSDTQLESYGKRAGFTPVQMDIVRDEYKTLQRELWMIEVTAATVTPVSETEWDISVPAFLDESTAAVEAFLSRVRSTIVGNTTQAFEKSIRSDPSLWSIGAAPKTYSVAMAGEQISIVSRIQMNGATKESVSAFNTKQVPPEFEAIWAIIPELSSENNKPKFED